MRKSLWAGVAIIIIGTAVSGGYYYAYQHAKYNLEKQLSLLKNKVPGYDVSYKNYTIHVLSRSVIFHDVTIKEKDITIVIGQVNMSVFGSNISHIIADHINMSDNAAARKSKSSADLSIDRLSLYNLIIPSNISDVFIIKEGRLQQVLLSNTNFDRLVLKKIKFNYNRGGWFKDTIVVDYLSIANFGLNRKSTVKLDKYHNLWASNFNQNSSFIQKKSIDSIQIKNINLAELSKQKEDYLNKIMNEKNYILSENELLKKQLLTASFDSLYIDNLAADYKYNDKRPFYLNIQQYKINNYGENKQTNQFVKNIAYSANYGGSIVDGHIDEVTLYDIPIVNMIKFSFELMEDNYKKNIKPTDIWRNILSQIHIGLLQINGFSSQIKDSSFKSKNNVRVGLKFDRYQMSNIIMGKKGSILLKQMSGNVRHHDQQHYVKLAQYSIEDFDLLAYMEALIGGGNYNNLRLPSHTVSIDQFKYGLSNVKDDPKAIEIKKVISSVVLLHNGDIKASMLWDHVVFPIDGYRAVEKKLYDVGYRNISTSGNIQAMYDLKGAQWNVSNGKIIVDDVGRATINLVLKGAPGLNMMDISSYQLVSLNMSLYEKGLIKHIVDTEQKKHSVLPFQALNYLVNNIKDDQQKQNSISPQQKKWNSVAAIMLREAIPRKQYRPPFYIVIEAKPDQPVFLGDLSKTDFIQDLEKIGAKISIAQETSIKK